MLKRFRMAAVAALGLAVLALGFCQPMHSTSAAVPDAAAAAADDSQPQLDLTPPEETGPVGDVDDEPTSARSTRASCPRDGCPTSRSSAAYRRGYRSVGGGAILGAPLRATARGVGLLARGTGKLIQGVRGRSVDRRMTRVDWRAGRLNAVSSNMASRGYRSRR